MADKEPTERRVYVLPAEQLARIRAYQSSSGIASEVEAVRRLLDTALQMRDTVPDLLKKLKSRYANEKDLKVLARDILAGHALVKSVLFEDGGVSFFLAREEGGRIDGGGKTYIAGDEPNTWHEFPPPQKQKAAGGGGGPNWDAPKGGDLDDEIPF